MAFEKVRGQEPAVQTLRHALASGRVHHAYRFEGPDGVGKELCAFELAKELVCPSGNEADRLRVETLSEDPPHVPQHPDVVLVQRGLYGKLISATELSGISVEQVRRIVLTRAGYSPHEGRALVFIVRDAEELTVSAANALLKTLEEPSPQTHFILLTSRPRRLLDTVLSRTLAVRFGLLSDDIVRDVLRERGLSVSVAPMAAGSAARALHLADAELVETREAFLRATLDAVSAPDLTAALSLSDARPNDKSELRDSLEYLAGHFVERARSMAASNPRAAELAARGHQIVCTSLTELERSAQPALVLETMVLRLRASY